ncbi:MAG: chloride channel protein [Corynebacterium sp.]|nr:chloride channel protein [Corynebacterium sp.]
MRRLAFWIPVAGVIAGLVGVCEIHFLSFVRWAMYGTYSTNFLQAHDHVHPLRMVLVPVVGGLIVACLWTIIRRRNRLVSVEAATEGARLPFIGTMSDALTQLIAVGSGFSIGREGAPRQMSAACIDLLLGKEKAEIRRLVLSCGAAAALASVYGAPWAGIPFALSTIYGQWTIAGVITSGLVSWIAAEVAWFFVGHRPVLFIGEVDSSYMASAWWVLVIIPCALVVARIFEKLCRVSTVAANPYVAMMGVGLLTGVIGLGLPQALGNGAATLLFDMQEPRVAVAAGFIISVGLLVVKPVLTSISLRAGMAGGLLMPAASTGAALGSSIFFGLLALGIIPREQELFILFVATGAAIVLGLTNKSMLFAVLCLVEITGMPLWWGGVIAIAGGVALGVNHGCSLAYRSRAMRRSP